MRKILIFAKSPVQGSVKTRLKNETPLSEKEILILYTAFLQDTVTSSVQSKADKIVISYFPVTSRKKMMASLARSPFKNELSAGRLSLIPQHGETFEERVTMSVREIWGPADSILVLGSDTPTLRPDIINKAFSFLRNRKEGMVLGPSGEGGVYLIGLKTKVSLNFQRIFDHGAEIENLVHLAKIKKLPILILEELTDVDIQTDLLTLVSNITALQYSSRFQRDIFLPHKTIRVLKSLKLKVKRSGNNTRSKILSKE